MLRIASSDFHAAAQAARGADKAIIREMRRGIRTAGASAVAEVRESIRRIPSSGKRSTGVRAALAAGTRVSIRTSSPRTAGALIVTSPTRLPAGRRPAAKALNLKKFRHPVFADAAKTRQEWAWADQEGRPYFGAAILRHREAMQSDVWRALARAERQIITKQREAAKDVR